MQALVTEAATEGLAARVFTTVGLTEAAGEEPTEAASEELGEGAPVWLALLDLLPVAEALLDLLPVAEISLDWLALLDLLGEACAEGLIGLVAAAETCDAPREGVAATDVLVLSGSDWEGVAASVATVEHHV